MLFREWVLFHKTIVYVSIVVLVLLDLDLKGFNLVLRSPFELLFMCWFLYHFGSGIPPQTHVYTSDLDTKIWEIGRKTVEV